MKKLSVILSASAILFSVNAYAGIAPACMAVYAGNPTPGAVRACQFGVDDIAKGAHCQIKKVVVLTKNAADCKSAGGVLFKVKE